MPSLYNGPYAVLQLQGSLRHFWLQMGDREDISRPQALHRRLLHRGATLAQLDPTPNRVRFNFTPPPPAAADPGTVFLGTLAGFLARPGEASSSRYPKRNRGPPAWQRGDYTFSAIAATKKLGELCGHAPQGLPVPTPLFASLVHYLMTSHFPVHDDRMATCTNQFFTFVYTVCNVTSMLLNKIQSILASCINHILLCYIFYNRSINSHY